MSFSFYELFLLLVFLLIQLPWASSTIMKSGNNIWLSCLAPDLNSRLVDTCCLAKDDSLYSRLYIFFIMNEWCILQNGDLQISIKNHLVTYLLNS